LYSYLIPEKAFCKYWKLAGQASRVILVGKGLFSGGIGILGGETVGIDAFDDGEFRYKGCGNFVGLAEVEPLAWVHSMS
jgi:hypothetical protein